MALGRHTTEQPSQPGVQQQQSGSAAAAPRLLSACTQERKISVVLCNTCLLYEYWSAATRIALARNADALQMHTDVMPKKHNPAKQLLLCLPWVAGGR
jgi:hypothetical protein